MAPTQTPTGVATVLGLVGAAAASALATSKRQRTVRLTRPVYGAVDPEIDGLDSVDELLAALPTTTPELPDVGDQQTGTPS